MRLKVGALNHNSNSSGSASTRSRARRPRCYSRPASLEFHRLECRNLLAANAAAWDFDWSEGVASDAHANHNSVHQVIPSGYGLDQLPVMELPPENAGVLESIDSGWLDAMDELEFIVNTSNPALLPLENITLAQDELALKVSLMPSPGHFGDVEVNIAAFSHDQVFSTTRLLVSVIEAVRQSGEVVTISGSEANDQISVSLDGEFNIDWNGYNFQIPLDEVGVVVILGNGGDDQILVSGLPAGLGLVVLAGTGNDRVQIATDVKSQAVIQGGSGIDTLLGRLGQDLIVANGADQFPEFELGSTFSSDGPVGVDALPFASASSWELALTMAVPNAPANPLPSTDSPLRLFTPVESPAPCAQATRANLPGKWQDVDAVGLLGLEFASSQMPRPDFSQVSRQKSIFEKPDDVGLPVLGSFRTDEEPTRLHSFQTRSVSAEHLLVLSLGCAEINKVFMVARPANQLTRRDD